MHRLPEDVAARQGGDRCEGGLLGIGFRHFVAEEAPEWLLGTLAEFLDR
ncbi:MAG TPA: hypothetical protein VGH76_17275 [Actinomycetospora sp.]